MSTFLQRLAPRHASLLRAGLAVTGLGALCGACSPVEYAQEPDCRQFVQPITVNGKQETRYTTQCRQADGSWKIIAQADSGTAQGQTAQTAQAPSGQGVLTSILPPAYPYAPALVAAGAPYPYYPYPYGYYDPWPGYYGPGYGLGFFGAGFAFSNRRFHDHFHHRFHDGFRHDGFHRGFHNRGFNSGGFNSGFHGGMGRMGGR
jgi:hypothetical protein